MLVVNETSCSSVVSSLPTDCRKPYLVHLTLCNFLGSAINAILLCKTTNKVQWRMPMWNNTQGVVFNIRKWSSTFGITGGYYFH